MLLPLTLIPLDHHIFDKKHAWIKGIPEAHLTVKVSTSFDTDSYTDLKLTAPRFPSKQTGTHALTDTGTQMTALGMELLHALGATKKDLVPVRTKIATANHSDSMSALKPGRER